MSPEWINYVSKKRQKVLLQILEELSLLQDKKELNFIIIGALPLLINGYLNYKVYWDIDLLFKDRQSLQGFISEPKPDSLRIVDYDEHLMVNKNISSLHTAWSFNKTWFNVDYIIKERRYFEFYTWKKENLKFYRESVLFNNREFRIDIYLANPWDIIIDKITSPRTARDIELKVEFSVDIRHIFAIYQKEKDNEKFWRYVFRKAAFFEKEQTFKKKFFKILSLAPELGYEQIKISDEVLKKLGQK